MSKRYRLKRNEYMILDRWFLGDEPKVMLGLVEGGGQVETTYEAFRADFEEVSEGEGEAREVPMDIAAPHRVLSNMLSGCGPFDGVEAKCGGRTARMAARELRDLLDAARKSLAGEGEPAERCRVGEWLPARYLGIKGVHLLAVCEKTERDAMEVRIWSKFHGKSDLPEPHMTADWDAARAVWIADGRPTS